MKDPWKKHRLIWPKDHLQPKGSDSWLGRLSDIVQGKGPDIFAAKGSKDLVRADRWGNWDSYHSQAHQKEERRFRPSLWHPSRGLQRYDPLTRTYKTWGHDDDFLGQGVDFNGVGPFGSGYVHFTDEEWRRMAPVLSHGRRVDPAGMGDQWHQGGPKRFDAQYDEFWRRAHRIGENRADIKRIYNTRGVSLRGDESFIIKNGLLNPLLRMRDPRRPTLNDELNDWLYKER